MAKKERKSLPEDLWPDPDYWTLKGRLQPGVLTLTPKQIKTAEADLDRWRYIALLRSNKTLTADDRKAVAKLLQGNRGGRPKLTEIDYRYKVQVAEAVEQLIADEMAAMKARGERPTIGAAKAAVVAAHSGGLTTEQIRRALEFLKKWQKTPPGS